MCSSYYESQAQPGMYVDHLMYTRPVTVKIMLSRYGRNSDINDYEYYDDS